MVKLGVTWSGCVSAAFAVLACSADAQSPPDALTTAFELCVSQLTNIDVVRDTLLQHGWEQNENAAFTTLFNAKIAFDFHADDLDYTFNNAVFMAGSVLGNSGLGSDQISVMFEDYQLAILGIKEISPYCVMTGPIDLITAFSDGGWQRQTQFRSDLIEQGVWANSNGSSSTVGIVDTDALLTLLEGSAPPNKAFAKLLPFLAPITIHFATTEVPS